MVAIGIIAPVTSTQGSIAERLRTALGDSGLLWRGSADRSVHLRRRLLIWTCITWVPLILLTALEGSAVGDPVRGFLSDPLPFARLLVAIPLFLLAEPLIDRRTAETIRYLDTSGVLSAKDCASWQATLVKIRQRGDAWLPEALIAAVSLLLGWTALSHLAGAGQAVEHESSWTWHATADGGQATWAGMWYVAVSGSIYRFFALRWLWRFALWVSLLWRTSRIPLRVLATHPDRAGGLGYLWRTQSAFLCICVALGASLSGSLAHGILLRGGSVADHYPVVVGFVLGGLIVVFAPLLLFSVQLLRARELALAEYSSLGEELSSEFRGAWIEGAGDSQDRIIDSVHPSSVGDYSAVFETVANMRLFPLGIRGVVTAVAVLVAPFVPLWLLEMPLKDLLEQLIGVFT